MRHAVRIFQGLFIMALMVACASVDLACIATQPVTLSFEFGGLTRSYRVYQSALYDGSVPFPLLVMLHGMDQTGDDMIPLTGMNAFADQIGFNVVYPDAYQGNWNDGRNVSGIAAYDANVDDVGFIQAVLDRVSSSLYVDDSRVYVAGMSNGAMMAHRLVCEAPERFAAAAMVAGALPANLEGACYPVLPVPIIAFNGKNDGVVPWSGGTIEMNGRNLGETLSVPATIARCVANNRCNPAAQIVAMPDASPTDGTRVYRETYTPQIGGADVVFYRIEGGGHTWPGGAFYQLLMGTISYDIDASALIARFCLDHTR